MKRTSSLVKRNTGPEADAAEATQQLRSAFASRDVETEASEAAASLIGKRKKPEYQPGKFKAVSQLVLAMNRFKASLNPTYTFGKRTESGSSGRNTLDEAQEFSSAPVNTPEEVTPIRRAYSSRGNKTKYLLTKLPPTAGEIKAAS